MSECTTANKEKMDKKESVLHKYPASLMGLPITPTQQICVCFLIPTIANCILYMVDLASCVAVIRCHFEEGNVKWALLTLTILYIPSFAFFIITVSQPDLWDEKCEQSHATTWFISRTVHLLVFPAWGIYRYAKQLFWTIEALACEGSKREEALVMASKPSHIELHLFLHAFLSNLPQILLQLSVMFILKDNRLETDSMQVLCVITSLMVLSITTVSFQRFESQKCLGRQKPWAQVPQKVDFHKDENSGQGKSSLVDEKTEHNSEKPAQDFDVNSEIGTPYLEPKVAHQHHLQASQPKSSIPSRRPPPPPPNYPPPMQLRPKPIQEHAIQFRKMTPPNCSPPPIPHEYSNFQKLEKSSRQAIREKTPSSSSSNCSPSQISRKNDQEIHMLPPSYTPPNPPKLNTDHDSEHGPKENASNQQVVTNPNPRQSNKLLLPVRKIPIKGLEEDDLLGKSVAFLAWFFFLLSRTLALVSFSHFFLWSGIGVCVIRYIITVSLLKSQSKCTGIEKVLVPLCLGYIFLFCFIEFKIRFRRPILCFFLYVVILVVENTAISTIWYVFSEWEGWWYNYTYIIIMGSFVLSITAMITYFQLLKPKAKIFYNEDNENLK